MIRQELNGATINDYKITTGWRSGLLFSLSHNVTFRCKRQSVTFACSAPMTVGFAATGYQPPKSKRHQELGRKGEATEIAIKPTA